MPFFAFLSEGRSISISTWVGAFLAFFGTVLLSSDGTPPNVGDFWSVLAAAASAMFILRLEKYSARCEASQLNSANLWVTSGLCAIWAGEVTLLLELLPCSLPFKMHSEIQLRVFSDACSLSSGWGNGEHHVASARLCVREQWRLYSAVESSDATEIQQTTRGIPTTRYVDIALILVLTRHLLDTTHVTFLASLFSSSSPQ